MKTRKITLFITTIMAGFLATTFAALAVPAVAKSAVNVRTGPGTNFTKIDTLHRGERVNVTQCQNGWCYVEKSGPDGWVAGNYLLPLNNGGRNNAGNNNNQNNNPPVNFGVTFGTGGASFSISIGNRPVTRPAPTPPPAPPITPKACFYDGANYTGAQYCVSSGTADNQLIGFWNNRISSFQLFGGAKVQLCKNWNYGGACFGYSSNRANLPFQINDKTSSYQVWN